MANTDPVSRATPAEPVSRHRRDCAEHSLSGSCPVCLGTLPCGCTQAYAEPGACNCGECLKAREVLDRLTPSTPSVDELFRRDREHKAAVEALQRHAAEPMPVPRATLADREAREYGIARALIEHATVPKRISSVLEIDLGGVPMQAPAPRVPSAREAMASVERAFAGYAQLRGEDAAASAMFDGGAPADDEPVVDVAAELQRVTAERDEAIGALDRAIDANRQLQQQLDAALARIVQLEEEADALRGVEP